MNKLPYSNTVGPLPYSVRSIEQLTANPNAGIVPEQVSGHCMSAREIGARFLKSRMTWAKLEEGTTGILALIGESAENPVEAPRNRKSSIRYHCDIPAAFDTSDGHCSLKKD